MAGIGLFFITFSLSHNFLFSSRTFSFFSHFTIFPIFSYFPWYLWISYVIPIFLSAVSITPSFFLPFVTFLSFYRVFLLPLLLHSFHYLSNIFSTLLLASFHFQRFSHFYFHRQGHSPFTLSLICFPDSLHIFPFSVIPQHQGHYSKLVQESVHSVRHS